MTIDTVALDFPSNCNIVVGQSHFIKTVEDISEIMMNSVPGIKFGSHSMRHLGHALCAPRALTPILWN